MELFQILNIVTCITSSLTAIVVCVALLPHLKNGMVIIRDAVLWLALIGLVIAFGWLGIDQLKNRGSASSSPDNAASAVLRPSVDSYYAGR